MDPGDTAPLELHADAAITSAEADRLGRAPLARQLARAVLDVPVTSGFAYAVQGPWGSGKSSLLNLLAAELARTAQERALVVRYEPWWFSGDEAILRHFLDHLGNSIAASSLWKSEAKKLGKAIQTLGRASAPAWEIVAPGPVGKKVADVQRNLSTQRVPDLFKLRDQIVRDLSKRDSRVVVLFDELDRLLPSELRTILRVVKSVARFPNVVYVLAYSRDETIAALDELVSGRGEAFLEKIIQAAIDLPAPQEDELRALLTQDLNKLLAATSEDLWDSHAWANLYLGGVRHLVRTPRDVARYVNMIAGTYPAIQTEVQGVDYFGLQALRLFAGAVHDAIQERPDLFVSPGKDARATLDAILAEVDSSPRRQAVRVILEQLFPRVRGVFGNTTYGAEWEASWRASRRIASADMLPVYFRLSVPANVISRQELAAVIQAASKGAEEFREQLLPLVELRTPTGDMRVILLLDWLEDHTADIEPRAFQTMATVLIDLGDRIHEGQGPRGILEPDADIRIMRILFQLLKRLPTQVERYRVYKQAIEDATSVSFPAEIVAVLGQEHGKRSNQPPGPEDQREISVMQMRQLERSVVKKLRKSASDGSLAAAPRLLALLLDWREWGGVRAPRAFVRKLVADDRGMVQLIESALGQGAAQGMGDYASRVTWNIQIEAFDPMVDVATLQRRAQRLLEESPDWLSERNRLALEVFDREATERGRQAARPRRKAARRA